MTVNTYLEISQEAIARAEKDGFTVHIRSKDELLLDLDDCLLTTFLEKLRSFCYSPAQMPRPLFYEWWLSKSGCHFHVKVQLTEDVTPPEAVAMQAMLGSDPKREMRALLDLRQGNPFYSILFQPKGSKVTREYWRA